MDIDRLFDSASAEDIQAATAVMLREIARALGDLVQQNRYAYFAVRVDGGYDVEVRVNRVTSEVEHFRFDRTTRSYRWQPLVTVGDYKGV